MMLSKSTRIFVSSVAILGFIALFGCGGPENVISDYSEPTPTMDYDLNMAEELFAAEEYEDAAWAYEIFIQNHPLNDNVPYALFRQGLSYFKISENAYRDQSPTERAAVTLSQLILMYPNSKYVSNAMSYLRLCHERLAEAGWHCAILAVTTLHRAIADFLLKPSTGGNLP